MANKVKTKKAALKRIKVTATGKLMRRNQLMNHLKHAKSAARVRRQQEPKQVERVDKATMRKLLPYHA